MSLSPKVANGLIFASAIGWIVVVGLALIGPLSITQGVSPLASLLALVLPLVAILVALGVATYSSRRGGSGLGALCIAVVTGLFGGLALLALPSYDGDGLWPLWVWWGAIAVAILSLIRRADRPTVQPPLPPPPD